MEFWTTVAVLRRRWYVVVPCLLLTAVVALFLVGQSKPMYRASGTMLLSKDARGDSTSTTAAANSQQSTTTAVVGDNPYLDMDRLQFANIIALVAVDSNFKDTLLAAGGSPNYEVIPPFGNTPSLTLSSSAPTEAEAMRTYRVLVETLKQEVIARQQQVANSNGELAKGFELNIPTHAYPQNGARTKGVIVIGIIGLLFSVGMALLVDSMLAARQRKKQPAGMVTLISNSRNPLDEIVDLPGSDDPEPQAGGGGKPTRW